MSDALQYGCHCVGSRVVSRVLFDLRPRYGWLLVILASAMLLLCYSAAMLLCCYAAMMSVDADCCCRLRRWSANVLEEEEREATAAAPVSLTAAAAYRTAMQHTYQHSSCPLPQHCHQVMLDRHAAAGT